MAAFSLFTAPTREALTSQAQAAPALRRIVTLSQPDGTTIQAIPMGDEHMSYWLDAQTGLYLTQDTLTHYWRVMTDDEATTTYSQWTESRQHAARTLHQIKTLGGVTPKNQVKLPMVLVQFSDLSLSEEFGSELFMDSVMNMMDFDRVAYTYGGKEYHTGSVRKYWNVQSFGKFDPVFDILGTITLPQSYSYYGAEGTTGHDAKVGSLIAEVVDSLIKRGSLDNAAQYDNNKDGKLDCLYIIYAGYGQNESGVADHIWAKNTTGYVYTLPDGTKTNLMLLSPELCGYRTANPYHVLPNIGVFTHEFGHSIGLPDFYGTNSSTASQCYGMDSWSLMDQGEYNGLGQIPGCLTTHERMYLGWLDEPQAVNAECRDTLAPCVSTGDVRIFRNPEVENEYITIENHQPENCWELTWGNAGYYYNQQHRGLLITYVYFDQSLWSVNGPNNTPSFQHCSPICADGDRYLYSNVTDQATFTAWKANLSSDIYPGKSNITTLDSTNTLFRWHSGDTIAFNITAIQTLADSSVVITFGNPKEDEQSSIDTLYDKQQPMRATKRMRGGQIYIVKGDKEYDLMGRPMRTSEQN